MSKYLVLSLKPYDFVNDDGERIQGAKVSYLNKKPSVRENETGFPPLIVSITNPNLLQDLKSAPAIYDMDFEQVTGRNNKPELMLSSLEYIAPVDFSLFFDN
jgi:hypothetical protein